MISILKGLGFLGVTQIVLSVIIVVCVIVALCFMRAHVMVLPDYSINVESIKIADRPDWAHESLGMQIRDAMPMQASIFDADLPRKVYDSCRNLSWVDEITSVRKVYPNTLELSMTLRKPAGYVRRNGERYLVDSGGKRLPYRYYRRTSGKPGLLNITGVTGLIPVVGKGWKDMDALLAAVATINDISGSEACMRAGVTTIDISNFNGRKYPTESRVVLWTKTHTRILWGRSSLNKEHGDISAEDKLFNLEGALAGITDLRKIDYIHVYTDKGHHPVMPRK